MRTTTRAALAAAAFMMSATIGTHAERAVPARPGAWTPAIVAPSTSRIAQGRGAAAPVTAEAIERGRQVLTQNCIACHGADGRGGPIPNTDLSRSPIVLADQGGRGLMAFLKVGRPDNRMPAFSLLESDVTDLATYLHSLVPATPAAGALRGASGPPVEVSGDAAAGAAYFKSAGCGTCHSVSGDFKGIASRLSPAAIQGRLVVPRGNGGYPRGFNSLPDPNDAQKTVTITNAAGAMLTGTLVWITDFYVTYTDAAGVRRTVTREGDIPKVVVTDPLQWHLDHMKTLTDKNMHDLTAYLVTIR